jgi:putative ABC transport system permease protein
MLPAWRLATSSAFARPSRTLLMIAVVAMAALLISAVGVAMGSLSAAINKRIETTVGIFDLRLKPAGRGSEMPASWLDTVKSWPETEAATGRYFESLALRFARPVWIKDVDGSFPRRVEMIGANASINGVVAQDEIRFRKAELVSGRWAQAPDEIVPDERLIASLSDRKGGRPGIAESLALLTRTGPAEPMKADPGPKVAADQAQADALNEASAANVGDTVEVARLLAAPVTLRIVGIARQPALGGRSSAYMTVEGLTALVGKPGTLSEIDLKLKPGADPDAVVAARTPALPTTLILQTTEKITSGLQRNMQTNQLGFLVASTMSFIAAGFIIMTGMGVGITERQRELAILRCVGATRWQLAQSQLFIGGIIGTLGATVGVPLGIAAAALMITIFKERLQADVTLPWGRIAGAFAGAVFAGVLGALYAAALAARVSPLRALAARASVPRARTIAILTVLGLLGIAVHLGVFTLLTGAERVVAAYLTLGLPGLMLGYFVMGVPVTLLIARLLGAPISRALGVPAGILRRTIRATPYRFGFTSGAMMAGLALMVAIWTQGGSIVRDWLDKIAFPDAFAAGTNFSPESQRQLASLPFVTDTCAVTLQPVETEVFGLKGLTRFKSFFVAFDPTPFFRMTRLTWIQGDPVTAIRRLEEGGAVIVAREFYVAKKLGVGDTFTCWDNGRKFDFEIVGVVASPGLEMVSRFFQVGEEFTDQSIHAVFGSRKDLKEKFNADAIGLIQMSLDPKISDEDAIAAIREKLFAAGLLDAGSGRQIKREILRFVNSSLLVSSCVAIFSMFVACLGVANLIIAGIQARQFEFGVLRAVGAERRTLVRIVLAEALIVAIAACILGTLMGVQGGFGGTRLNKFLWGIDVGLAFPWLAVACGWGFVVLMTLGAAAPAVASLSRKSPRELLGSMKG